MTASADSVSLPMPFPVPAPAAAADAPARAVALDLDGDAPRLLGELAATAGGGSVDALVAGVGALLMRYTRHTEVLVALVEPGAQAADPGSTSAVRARRLAIQIDPEQGITTLVKTVGAIRRSDATGAAEAAVPALTPPPSAPSSGEALRAAPEPVTVVDSASGGRIAPPAATLWIELTPAEALLWYDPRCWPETSAEQLARHLAALLRNAASDPDRQLDDLELLDAAEQRSVVEEPNRTETPRADRSTVGERVRRWADRQPDQPAVVAAGRELSYAELVAAATQVAVTLREYGVGRDDLVGLLLDRSPELVVCALGVLLAGGAYVGLDRDEPDARLATMLDDAACRVLVTEAETARRLTDAGAVPQATRVLTIESLLTEAGADAVGPGDGSAAPAPGEDDLCYVTYTSGSTGRPKGVLVPHGGVANLVDWYRDTFDVRPGDRMPQLARPSFDGWALEVWPCLANGATLHLVDRRRLDSPAEFGDWLVAQGITVCFLTTVLARELFDYPWPADRTRLRHLLLGGEKLHRYPPAGLPFRLYNVYGPTETTMLATCGEMDPANPRDVAPPIGHPLANVRAYVLDDRGRPVPEGAVGELHLGGAGVARGYLNRPELTAQRFQPDPFTSPPGRRYATGDLVRRLPGGALAFVGRVDDQVKVRGFRIELGEIETALRALPEVRDAVVVVRSGTSGASETDGPGADRLIGYVVPRDPDRPPQAGRLREELGRALPPFMVPHLFAYLDAIPLTPHGKVARAELSRRPLPAPAPTTAAPDAIAPIETASAATGSTTTASAGPSGLSPVEGLLAELWREVLEVDAVDRDDSFFDLGGDSLQAMRVAARARERGLHFGAEDLFEHEILHELAAALDERGDARRGA